MELRQTNIEGLAEAVALKNLPFLNDPEMTSGKQEITAKQILALLDRETMPKFAIVSKEPKAAASIG